MDALTTIISLISGAVGGNIAGAAMPEKNLGGIGNTIAGLIGGGVGQFLLKALGVLAAVNAPGATETAAQAHGLDWAAILSSIGAGGVSGGVLTAIVALIKDAMQKKS